MSKVKGTGHNIAYAVSYKAAVDLVANGIVELDTEDVGAEVAELADVLFEHYADRLQEETPRGGGRPKGGGSKTRSSGRSSGSNRRGSSRSGSNSDGKPSGKQLAYLSDLLRDRDHGYDIDYDEGEDKVHGYEGKELGDLTRQEVSALIEEVRNAPEL